MVKLCLVLCLFYCSSYSQDHGIDLAIIAMIESSNNPLAHNKYDGGSRGLYQINPICLKDYNIQMSTKHTLDDLFNPDLNKRIAKWMFEVRIPQYLNRLGLPLSLDNKIIAYNAGILYLSKKKTIPKTTLDYISKYKKLKQPKDLSKVSL